MRRIPVLSLALGALVALGCAPAPAETSLSSPAPLATPMAAGAHAVVGSREIPVEIADTPESRRQGLSGRESLARDTGMALVWTTPMAVKIWMPDMRFPLDVLFVKDQRLHALYEDVQPCLQDEACPSFGPDDAVDWVLEVPAGSARRWGLKAGDPVVLVR